MTYAEKLLDPRWQKRRLEILERDGFTCQECGEQNRTLHVHHKFYDTNLEPWEYQPFALITLCGDCHSLAGLQLKHIKVFFGHQKIENLQRFNSALMCAQANKWTEEIISSLTETLETKFGNRKEGTYEYDLSN